MNEQDTTAEDTILLMEVEKKVRERIVKVIESELYGALYPKIKSIAFEAAKELITTAKITTY